MQEPLFLHTLVILCHAIVTILTGVRWHLFAQQTESAQPSVSVNRAPPHLPSTQEKSGKRELWLPGTCLLLPLLSTIPQRRWFSPAGCPCTWAQHSIPAEIVPTRWVAEHANCTSHRHVIIPHQLVFPNEWAINLITTFPWKTG